MQLTRNIGSSIVVFLLCCYTWDAAAQRQEVHCSNIPRHMFWGGSPLRGLKNWSVGYQFRPTCKGAIDLRFNHFGHNDAAAMGIAPGTVSHEYFSLQWEYKRNFPPYRLESVRVETFGKPLDPIPEIVPTQTYQWMLGWSFLLEPSQKRIYFSFTPGLVFARHYFFKVDQRLLTKIKPLGQRVIAASGYELLEVGTAYDYVDQRIIDSHVGNYAGFAYDLGVGVKASRNVLLEARLGGLMMPDGPYENRTTVPMKPMQATYLLRMGIGF